MTGRLKPRMAVMIAEVHHQTTMADLNVLQTYRVTVKHLLVDVADSLAVEPLRGYLLRLSIGNGLAENATTTTGLCEHHHATHERRQYDHHLLGKHAILGI